MTFPVTQIENKKGRKRKSQHKIVQVKTQNKSYGKYDMLIRNFMIDILF